MGLLPYTRVVDEKGVCMCKFKITIFAGLLLLTQGVSAKSEMELDGLQRVVSELKFVKEMVIETRRYKSPGAVDEFLYDEALRDLDVITMSIEDYISGRFDPTYQREPLRLEASRRADESRVH
jgi:hypothetical protein